MRRTLDWLLPGGVVLLVGFSVALGPAGLASAASTGLPWIAFGWAAYVAATRHRSRVMALVAGLSVLELLGSGGGESASAFQLGGGLFALAAVLLVALDDHRVLSVRGLGQLGLVAVPGALAGVAFRRAPDALESFLSLEVIPWLTFGGDGLSQPVAAAFVLASFLGLGVASLRGGAVERGAWWAMVSVGLALFLAEESSAASILLMSGCLILGLSVLDPSARWAERDELTGLPGRTLLLRDLQSMGGVFATSVVDIQDFRNLQDRHGHDVSGQILRMVASRLAKLPGGGRAYRYGSDEFALLFPGKTKEEALQHLGSFQRSLEESPFVLRRWPRPGGSTEDRKSPDPEADPPPAWLPLRVSIGVADSAGAHSSPEAILGRADEEAHRPAGPS
jgi:GGDEF domain-containing protein